VLLAQPRSALRDLRRDLFTHLRAASFYDKVAVGRVMTRVTNDVEVLYELLRGFGLLVGELVPFALALALMLAADPALTGVLLIVVPVVGLATLAFRRATRGVGRAAWSPPQPEPPGEPLRRRRGAAPRARGAEPRALSRDQPRQPRLEWRAIDQSPTRTRRAWLPRRSH
jgi:ABC-type multidrug transport system fused ATPase/permease subunit